MRTYGDLRRYLLTEISAARREYFRLKSELDQLNPVLPVGCYIGNYISNYRYTYHALGHKDAVLPSATDPATGTKKLHLGSSGNPNYRHALLELEKTRTYQLKQEILEGVTKHLIALEITIAFWRPLWRSHKPTDVILKPPKKSGEAKQLMEFISADKKESILDSIKRQHYTRTYFHT